MLSTPLSLKAASPLFGTHAGAQQPHCNRVILAAALGLPNRTNASWSDVTQRLDEVLSGQRLLSPEQDKLLHILGRPIRIIETVPTSTLITVLKEIIQNKGSELAPDAAITRQEVADGIEAYQKRIANLNSI